MSGFTTPLLVEISQGNQAGRGLVMLYKPFTYETKDSYSVTVPVGFRTDFASIPRLARGVFSPLDKYAKAAVLHDFLLTLPGWKRRDADKQFREALKVLGCPRWRRWIMWLAVRANGLLAGLR